VLRRQLSRIARIDDLLDLLPPGLTFDLGLDDAGANDESAVENFVELGSASRMGIVAHPTVKRIPGWRWTPSRDFVVLCYAGS
jgi:hypothetical protein